jgi:hypothetical protein
MEWFMRDEEKSKGCCLRNFSEKKEFELNGDDSLRHGRTASASCSTMAYRKHRYSAVFFLKVRL